MNKRNALATLRSLAAANEQHMHMVIRTTPQERDEVRAFTVSVSLAILVMQDRIARSREKKFSRTDILKEVEELSITAKPIAEELVDIFKDRETQPTKEEVIAALDKMKHVHSGGRLN